MLLSYLRITALLTGETPRSFVINNLFIFLISLLRFEKKSSGVELVLRIFSKTIVLGISLEVFFHSTSAVILWRS